MVLNRTFFLVLGLRSVCWYQQYTSSNLLAGSVLGHRLGALADSVLGELTGEKETHSSLDLSGGDGGTLVVVSKTAALLRLRPTLDFA